MRKDMMACFYLFVITRLLQVGQEHFRLWSIRAFVTYCELLQPENVHFRPKINFLVLKCSFEALKQQSLELVFKRRFSLEC